MKLHTASVDDVIGGAQHAWYLTLQAADSTVFAVLRSGVPDAAGARNPEAQRWNPSSYK
jgi:hypothetical protein